MNFFKCPHCGKIISSENENVECCNMTITLLMEHDTFNEKHTPCYEIDNNKIKVIVNHVMAPDHFIEFIAISYNGNVEIRKFTPNDAYPVSIFAIPDGIRDIKLYALCNTHGLFTNNVK